MTHLKASVRPPTLLLLKSRGDIAEKAGGCSVRIGSKGLFVSYVVEYFRRYHNIPIFFLMAYNLYENLL